jgi:hypothetical protein
MIPPCLWHVSDPTARCQRDARPQRVVRAIPNLRQLITIRPKEYAASVRELSCPLIAGERSASPRCIYTARFSVPITMHDIYSIA